MNSIFNKYLDKQYKYRLSTDYFFEKPQLPLKLYGLMGKSVCFVEKHQSLNSDLWTTFVEQFRIQDDGPDMRWRCEYWGKMMRGACFIYKVTLNKKLLKVLTKSIKDMLTVQDDEGRFSTYKKEFEFTGWDIWGRKYVMLGFIYFLEICKDQELKNTIIDALKKHANYILNNIGEGKKDIFETSYIWGCLQSSSILEPFVKLYALTDEKKYLDFSKYLVEKGGSSLGNMIDAALDKDLKPSQFPVTKAYEAMSFFEGLAEYYSITKIEKYKDAFLRFADKIIDFEFTVIGGSGCTHELFDDSAAHQSEFKEEVMQETCVTVTLLKMFTRALELTKNSKFADKMEVSYYNCLMNATNFDLNDELFWDPKFLEECFIDLSQSEKWLKKIKGYTFDSYAPLYKQSRNRKTGGFNFMQGGKSYGCCACIGALGTAALPLNALMISKDGIVINFFEKLRGQLLTSNGQLVDIKINTNYPTSNNVSINIATKENEEFKVYIRVPEFAKNCLINNKKFDSGKYAVIDFNGKSFDIEMTFSMELEVKELNDKIYVSKGPIVYCVDNRIEDLNKKATRNVVSIKPIKVPVRFNEAFEISFDNHETIKFIDYGSAGSNWYNGKNIISVFLDK